MKKLISCFLISCFLISIPCFSASSVEYILGANDILEVKIIGQPDLTTKQVVTPDGKISLPVLGRVRVEGLTAKQLDEYLSAEFAKYIEKAQVVVYLTARPIYIIQHDVKKNTWEVKEAKSIEEARALAGKDYKGEIKHGDIINVEVSRKPDFWEANWYKVITATAVLAGIYATLNR
ncbi:MAG: polysaccharide biosynthesis/export family protein [Patescibacteria group bacterium]